MFMWFIPVCLLHNILEMQLPAFLFFFFLGILHQSGIAAKTTLAQTSIQLTSIVMENLKTALSYVLHSCMTVLCSLS